MKISLAGYFLPVLPSVNLDLLMGETDFILELKYWSLAFLFKSPSLVLNF